MPSTEGAGERAGAVLTIDLTAIVANYRLLCRRLGAAGCAAVVKADAYGLGASQVAPTLAEAGCTMADVVKNTIWLEDPRDFAGFNKVYAEFFAEDPPARATVRSDLMLDAKIEIEALAYKPL